MKVKIVEPGFESFTGHFGLVEFQNGVSLRDVEPYELDRLAANVRIENLKGQAAGVADRMVEAHNEVAPVISPLVRGLPEQVMAPVPKTVAEGLPPRVYSEKELGAIADEGGIKMLREIGEKWEVKGRGIAELIHDILDAEDRYCEARGLIKTHRLDMNDGDVVVEGIDEPEKAKDAAAKIGDMAEALNAALAAETNEAQKDE
ncbi:hypothetical protein F1188_16340 [Roseospira marina]|uniref:Uncharacterized protein n=1 Tax=Roseospira marina TaxID=140057 RepID=A0A5M6I856_9PROT|nr:hypothetical protein [Roseospira marina]KAA5604426.1 hypothetical protein F1188_16340 [Roseospira marina]MBB4315376.1 hypothetical protein [Roseospira marina]MBB5088479.1 hypothetical protein [Roseospira marina]